MTDLAGKTGLDRRRRQQALDRVGDRAGARRRAGARLAVTYQGERLEENVRELSAALTDPLILPLRRHRRRADATRVRGRSTRSSAASTSSCTARRSRRARSWRRRSSRRRARASALSLDISAYSLIALARGAAPLMEKPRRRQHPDADLPRQRARLPELQRDGRRQGRARGVGPLSRRRPRPEEHPRQRDLRRPDQDAGGVGHLRVLEHPAASTAIARRCAARSRPPKSRMRRCSCSVPAGRAVTAEVLMVDGGYHATGM